jgi:hypothetical protein
VSDLLVVTQLEVLSEAVETVVLLETGLPSELLTVVETELLQDLAPDGSLVDHVESVVMLETAAQGPAGPQGLTGAPGGTAVTATAGEAIGGNRAVLLDAAGLAWYADRTTPAHLGRLAGITQGAASLGAAVTLVSYGLMVEPSWAWTPDTPVYLGTAGLLTQTTPTSGFLQIIGIALSATTLFINPREPLAIV